MKKFQSILTRKGDDVINARAENVTKLAEMAQTNLIADLEKQKIELEFKKQEMLDMSPDNRYSLRVGESFKADNWVIDYQATNLKLINLEVELTIAKTTVKELFEDVEIEQG